MGRVGGDRFFDVNPVKPAGKLPNFTRRMLWVVAGQMLLVVALLVWSEVFPRWLNELIVVSAVVVPPLAYLTVFTRPAMRQAWRNLLLDSWASVVFLVVGFVRLFRPAIIIKLFRYVATMKKMPDTLDEWITFCILPFKTCIVAMFPVIWASKQFITHILGRPTHYSEGLEWLVAQCLVISFLALLLGAGVQAILCRAGRATTTLRFALLGFGFLLILFFLSVLLPGKADKPG